MIKKGEESFYDILGIKEDASQEEIKKAHRGKIKEIGHPDKFANDPAKKEKQQEIISKINGAHATLSDPAKRREYDAQRIYGDGRSGPFSGGFSSSGFSSQGFDFSDIFESAFGGGFKKGREETRKDSPQRGSDIEISLTISFQEFVHGCSRQVSFNYSKSCSHCSQTGAFSNEYLKQCSKCKGSGVVYVYQKNFIVTFQTATQCTNCNGAGSLILKKCQFCNGKKFTTEVRKQTINVPRGIKTNEGLRITGIGNDGYKTRSSGDLVITIKVESDSYFERRENNLYVNLPISFLDSITGDYVELLTSEGFEKIKVPIGTQSGDTYLLRGRGFYWGVNSSSRGDLIIRFEVKFPKSISEENKEIFARIKRKATWDPNQAFIKKRKG